MSTDKDPLGSITKKLLEWIETKKESPTTPPKKESVGSWVVGLIVGSLALMLLTFLSWKAWKKGKELAELKHIIDTQKEEKQRLVVDKKVSQAEYDRELLVSFGKAKDLAIAETKSKIDKVESDRKQIHAEIDKITSWGDIDNLLGD